MGRVYSLLFTGQTLLQRRENRRIRAKVLFSILYLPFSLLRPRQDERQPPFLRVDRLGLLNGSGGVHVFRTNPAALADERALPDAFAAGDHLGPDLLCPVARVEIVALGQGDRRWSQELGLQPIDRAGRVTQHAVDAHAVLLILGELLRRL